MQYFCSQYFTDHTMQLTKKTYLKDPAFNYKMNLPFLNGFYTLHSVIDNLDMLLVVVVFSQWQLNIGHAN